MAVKTTHKYRVAEIGGDARGFTLVELLVVISIIALLLSILMPALNRARESAKIVVCRSNLKQQGTAFSLYSDENREIMLTEEAGWNAGASKPWMACLLPYIGRNIPKLSDQVWDSGGAIKIFKCPSYKDTFYFDNGGMSYGLNVIYASHFDPGTGQMSTVVKRTQISQPSKRMHVADTMEYKRPLSPELLKEYTRIKWCGVKFTTWLTATAFGMMWDIPPADRHNGGSNVLFVDGHTELMKFREIMPRIGEPADTWNRKVQLWGEPKELLR